MTINAHILVNDKYDSTIQLTDDPGEPELIQALGGSNADMGAHTFGRIGPWEVLYVASQPTKKLVIGAAPQLSAPVKRRRDCTLTQKQAEDLVSGIRHLWHLVGATVQD